MRDYLSRNKVFLAIGAITALLLVGGIFLFSKKGVPEKPKVMSSEILLPADIPVTSGYLNGEYLPASPSATVTLVEFGDYECPACAIYHPYATRLLAEFAGKINYAFRDFPLSQHKDAPLASYAAHAAGLQGKYWEMRDIIFSSQDKWVGDASPKDRFVGFAQQLGLDAAKFKSDLDSEKIKSIVTKGLDDGFKVGIRETPTFFLNGVKVDLTGGYAQLENAVKSAISQ